MIIDLYINKSDNREVHKNIMAVQSSISCDIWEPCTIESPVFILDYDADYINANYAYISQFGRYYYITDKTIIEGAKVRLTLKSDVLMSFFASCGNSQIIANRSSSHPDYRIDDPMILKLPEPEISIRKTALKFTTSNSNNYILTVSG